MAKVKSAIENDDKDKSKIDAVCRDYTQAIKESVVKDTSSIIRKIAKPTKGGDKSSSSKSKTTLPTGLKDKAASIAKKAGESVENLTMGE